MEFEESIPDRMFIKQHAMSMEEIEELLNKFDQEEKEIEESMQDYEVMVWIQNCIDAAITEYIKEYKKYPTKEQLIEIYSKEFTNKYRFVRKFDTVYWFCVDMVRIFKGPIPYTVDINEQDETVKVVFATYE